MTSATTEEVLVLDFGGQYSQLIARRIRECGVFAELLPASTSIEDIESRSPKALVLSGGPASVYDPGAPDFPEKLTRLGIPVLGICYGMQAMAHALGGKVKGADAGEFGRTDLTVTGDGGVLRRRPGGARRPWRSRGGDPNGRAGALAGGPGRRRRRVVAAQTREHLG